MSMWIEMSQYIPNTATSNEPATNASGNDDHPGMPEERSAKAAMLTHGQMAVIAASGRRLAGLSPAWPLGLGVGGILEFIGAVAARLLLGTASKAFGLQLADLSAELFVLLLHGRETAQGIGVSALPISGLLSQFQVVPP